MNGPLRGERLAVGGLYGALAVVVVATVVVGLALAAAPPSHIAAPSRSEGKLADLFLEAILASADGDGPTSVQEAIADLCLSDPCPPGSHLRSRLTLNISTLAAPLAQGLGRRWSCSVSSGPWVVLAVGDLPEQIPATASSVDILHGPSGGYLTLTLRLSRP